MNQTKLINSKMVAVMKSIGAIGKDQKNVAQGFKFRGIDQFVNSLYPALCEHGVFITPRILDRHQQIVEVAKSSGGTRYDTHVWLTVEYGFHAEDGSCVTLSTVGEGIDSGDKATNKAMSAALKYALIQAFCIPTEDMEEADLTSPEQGKPTQLPAPKEVKPSGGFKAASGMPNGWA